MDVEITGVGDTDWPAFRRVDELAFGYTWPEPSEEPREPLERDRSIIARVDGEPVGIASIYTLSLAVPGGRDVATAGVTWVGVLPTHRRQGVLTAMMRHQLDGLRGGAEPIAALWASEPGIYGRFGFGVATRKLSVDFAKRGAQLRRERDPRVSLRLVAPVDAFDAVRSVESVVRGRRPGMPLRGDSWLKRLVHDPAAERAGASELRAVVATIDHSPQGYAFFRTKPDWSNNFAVGTVDVREVLAADPAAHAEIWRFLLSVDLMDTVDAWNLPADDPLLDLLVDPRRAKPELSESLYVRLVDLPTALAARTYAAPADVVLEVTDDFGPWNSGRWRLSAGPEGAVCSPTSDPADLALDVRELGAAYLGGVALAALAESGLVQERRPGALAAASTAFRHDPAPYCPFVF